MESTCRMLKRWGICGPRGAFRLVERASVDHAPTGASEKNSDAEREEISGEVITCGAS